MKFDFSYLWKIAQPYAEQPFWLYEVGQLRTSVGEHLETGNAVLDVGCSDGAMCAVFKALYRQSLVCGCDVNEDAIISGIPKHFEKGMSLLVQPTAGTLPYDGRVFGAVVSLNTLGHCDHPKDIVREMHRVLAPGGKVAIVVPDKRYYRASYVKGTWPTDPTQLHEFGPHSLAALFKEAGFRGVTTKGFGHRGTMAPWIRARILLEGYKL